MLAAFFQRLPLRTRTVVATILFAPAGRILGVVTLHDLLRAQSLFARDEDA